MDNFPRTITEFEEWFSTEDSCREYLWELRWPNGFECPKCSHDKTWTTSRELYECAHCGVQISVTSGT
ncbi:MAG: transposase, partial [Bacteroidetes bacterium]|nr:transposase [Bacteroidota bacterium]